MAAAAFCVQLNCGSQFLYAPAGLRENSSESVNVEITRESELCLGENKAHEWIEEESGHGGIMQQFMSEFLLQPDLLLRLLLPANKSLWIELIRYSSSSAIC